MKLHGKIVAADSTEKTITIQCDGSISGVQIAGRVIVSDEWPEEKQLLTDTKKKNES